MRSMAFINKIRAVTERRLGNNIQSSRCTQRRIKVMEYKRDTREDKGHGEMDVTKTEWGEGGNKGGMGRGGWNTKGGGGRVREESRLISLYIRNVNLRIITIIFNSHSLRCTHQLPEVNMYLKVVSEANEGNHSSG